MQVTSSVLYHIQLRICCLINDATTCFFQDAEGLIVLNISSYMGGVDLWQSDGEHDDHFTRQSMHDKMLEVVCVSGAWHLGKLQVCV